MKRLVIYSLCLSLGAPAAFSADSGPLRGFSTDSARTQRDWETRFRAIPDPANLRSYMQRLAARPHHVGSPYDKDNAEWILSKFKEWGLDAQIETFDVLFPPRKSARSSWWSRGTSRPNWKSRWSQPIPLLRSARSNCQPTMPTRLTAM